MDAKILTHNQQLLKAGNPALTAAYRQSVQEADRLVKNSKVYSVMDKLPLPCLLYTSICVKDTADTQTR